MKIKLIQILAITYIGIIFFLGKSIPLHTFILMAAAFIIEYATSLKPELKNIIYFTAAISAFPQFFFIFLLFLPFAVFGALFSKTGFIKSYILGFVLTFLPYNILYLVSTYFSLHLSFWVILGIVYALPVLAIIILQKRALPFFEIDTKESIILFTALIFTTIIAINIVDEQSLFIANGVRIFSRVNFQLYGLQHAGELPTYNPAIAQGESTGLWNTPSFKIHPALSNYLLGFIPPILFFNALSFFILFLSTAGISLILTQILGGSRSLSDTLLIAVTSALVGLNFFSLQMLESFKAYYAYPFAYLFISIILENPKKINEYLVLLYIPVILITNHIAYGAGVILIGGCIFLLRKGYCIRDRSEILGIIRQPPAQKAIGAALIFFIILMPLFYLSAGFLFKDFLDKGTVSFNITVQTMQRDFTNFFREYIQDIRLYSSLRYPDVSRIDDHTFGFFIAIFGPLCFLICLALWASKSTKTWRILVIGFALNLIISGLFYYKFTSLVGGFFRTAMPYTLLILGSSIALAVFMIKNKILKSAAIIIMFLAFIHTIPVARQNITNIHREYFASGEIYKQELEFIRQLPIDGRILTYGVFNNAIDFGGMYLTRHYFSRDERSFFNLERRLFEQVHGQHSFGEPDIVLKKSGVELSNYLRLGGWKYIFLDARHEISQHVILELTPLLAQKLYKDIPAQYHLENKTEYAFPIYQNGPLFILVVNDTAYAEKTDIVRQLPPEIYTTADGYKYVTVSPYYNFAVDTVPVTENPGQPTPLAFERLSETQVTIRGDFVEGNFVVFKEQYFPRWRAFMNGQEVPVYATLHDLVLIKTIAGTDITLKYMVLPIEKFFGTLSLVGHLGLALLIFYLLRNIKKIPPHSTPAHHTEQHAP